MKKNNNTRTGRAEDGDEEYWTRWEFYLNHVYEVQ